MKKKVLRLNLIFIFYFIIYKWNCLGYLRFWTMFENYLGNLLCLDSFRCFNKLFLWIIMKQGHQLEFMLCDTLTYISGDSNQFGHGNIGSLPCFASPPPPSWIIYLFIYTCNSWNIMLYQVLLLFLIFWCMMKLLS